MDTVERTHDLETGDYGFGEWLSDFESSAAYRDGDKLLGMDARVDYMGSTAIYATVEDSAGEVRELSPYFNQMATECADDCDGDCDGDCDSETQQVENDAREWLVMMAGATNWHEWDWMKV